MEVALKYHSRKKSNIYIKLKHWFIQFLSHLEWRHLTCTHIWINSVQCSHLGLCSWVEEPTLAFSCRNERKGGGNFRSWDSLVTARAAVCWFLSAQGLGISFLGRFVSQQVLWEQVWSILMLNRKMCIVEKYLKWRLGITFQTSGADPFTV